MISAYFKKFQTEITASETDEVRQKEPSRWHRHKWLLDRVAAGLLLILGLPLICVLVVLIRVTSRGPAIFRQVRVGRNGRTFTMFKLRTMICDAEAKSGPMWTQDGDPRVTPAGRVLRKVHLDELPQLFNVLRGEMSLIGPRPERPEFTEALSEVLPNFPNRLAVAPGVTGLAQINLPADSDINDVRRKLVLDDEYVERASLLLDLAIFLATALRIVGVPGAVAARIARVERQVLLEPQSGTGTDATLTPARLIAMKAGRAEKPTVVSGQHTDPAISGASTSE